MKIYLNALLYNILDAAWKSVICEVRVGTVLACSTEHSGVGAFSSVHVAEDSLKELGTLASASIGTPLLSKSSGFIGGGSSIGSDVIRDDSLKEVLDVGSAGESIPGL